MRIARHAVAGDLAVNRRTAVLRVFQLLDHEDAGAFADDEAVAIQVPWTRGALWLIVAQRERAHRSETANRELADHGLAAAGKHDVVVIALDYFEGVADGVGARRA